MPLCYALYAALVGSLNGRRMFLHQAGLDITFSTVRTFGILGRGLTRLRCRRRDLRALLSAR